MYMCGAWNTSGPNLEPLGQQENCLENNRNCASVPFLYPVKHPPWYQCPPKCPVIRRPLIRKFPTDTNLWYEKNNDYMHYSLEDKVMPGMAFQVYCDSIPERPSSINYLATCDDCTRGVSGGWERPKQPWPPLPQGACPPPRECAPCGPGPWSNPDVRRFFYYNCV